MRVTVPSVSERAGDLAEAAEPGRR